MHIDRCAPPPPAPVPVSSLTLEIKSEPDELAELDVKGDPDGAASRACGQPGAGQPIVGRRLAVGERAPTANHARVPGAAQSRVAPRYARMLHVFQIAVANCGVYAAARVRSRRAERRDRVQLSSGCDARNVQVFLSPVASTGRRPETATTTAVHTTATWRPTLRTSSMHNSTSSRLIQTGRSSTVCPGLWRMPRHQISSCQSTLLWTFTPWRASASSRSSSPVPSTVKKAKRSEGGKSGVSIYLGTKASRPILTTSCTARCVLRSPVPLHPANPSNQAPADFQT